MHACAIGWKFEFSQKFNNVHLLYLHHSWEKNRISEKKFASNFWDENNLNNMNPSYIIELIKDKDLMSTFCTYCICSQFTKDGSKSKWKQSALCNFFASSVSFTRIEGFLDEIQTKVLRIFLLAIHSHLYSFALRFLFL